MPSLGYRNASITAIHHINKENKLILAFDDLPDFEIHNVVDFTLNGFYPQNILFDVYAYASQDLPAKIAAEFPLLSYYLHNGENWQIYHLSPQTGMGGIIVCATF
ncbi:MAG: hypothetical protein Q4B82_04740 [Alysiella sp.]|uniref:hypothetical protein n=1 Tax=Alysiella sp. TaxID=1872483 RepID=UPI0026DDA445|nr:hypothetical protein [Alysiella sp.]MDO4433869.1 hypothetical protein [Alysiella sp.]